jgi:uncharacterized protein (TIGR02147 family)
MRTSRTEIQQNPRSPTGTILRQWLSERIEVNPAYSLRAMARAFDVSPGFLSQVMSGRKRVTTERAIQFSQVMKLGDEATTALLMAAAVESARSGTKARALLERIAGESTAGSDYQSVELERFKALSQWYHLAILDLSETIDFRAEPTWLAKRLRISPLQVAGALDRLRDLGLLVKKDQTWRKAQARIRVSAKQSNAAIREYHKQMIGKALAGS